MSKFKPIQRYSTADLDTKVAVDEMARALKANPDDLGPKTTVFVDNDPDNGYYVGVPTGDAVPAIPELDKLICDEVCETPERLRMGS